MDREKVINDLQDAVNDDWMWQHADYYAKAMENAIALLKEQEAKKVESIQIRRNFYAELTGYCPSCNRPLRDQFNKYFCGNCGQAVKWD